MSFLRNILHALNPRKEDVIEMPAWMNPHNEDNAASEHIKWDEHNSGRLSWVSEDETTYASLKEVATNIWSLSIASSTAGGDHYENLGAVSEDEAKRQASNVVYAFELNRANKLAWDDLKALHAQAEALKAEPQDYLVSWQLPDGSGRTFRMGCVAFSPKAAATRMSSATSGTLGHVPDRDRFKELNHRGMQIGDHVIVAGGDESVVTAKELYMDYDVWRDYDPTNDPASWEQLVARQAQADQLAAHLLDVPRDQGRGGIGL